MSLSLLLWVCLLGVPFLPVSMVGLGAVTTAVIVVAEVAFWVGAAVAGPEAARRMRSWWRTSPCVSVGSGRLRQQHDAAPDPANPALPLCVPERPTGGKIAHPLRYPTWPWHQALASAPIKSPP